MKIHSFALRAAVALAFIAASQLPAHAQAQAPARAPNDRPCIVLSGGSGAPIERRDVEDDSLQANRGITAGLYQRLQREAYVATSVFTERADRTLAPSKPMAALARNRCSLLLSVAHVFATATLGGYFGFDVAVQRIANEGDTLVPQQVFLQRYRFLLDKKTLDDFRTDTFAGQVWADLRAAHVLDAALAAPLDAALVRAEYDRVLSRWGNPQELHVRHILLRSEAEARVALARIRDEHKPFEVVALELSLDTGSDKAGGDLGWATADTYVPAFARAATALAPKGMSADPVQTPFGWHLIEVLDQRRREPPAFDDVKERIAATLRWQRVVPPDAKSEAKPAKAS